MKTEKWTREFVAEKTRNALKECDIITVTDLKNGDKPLAIDSFDWYNLWMTLEKELGVLMNFDPSDGLTSIPNCTMNIIIDFIYNRLNAEESVKKVVQKKSSILGNFFQRNRVK